MSFRIISFAFLFAFAGILISIDASAQERMKYPDEASTVKNESRASSVAGKDRFTVKELTKTERGRELVDQLRVLRNSESTMGERHPLLPKIKEEIEQVKGLLRNRMVAEKIADEMDDEDEVKQIATVLPGMNDDDLRRLVLRLIVRVDSLEKEVEALKEEATDKTVAKTEAPTPEAEVKSEEKKSEENLFDGSLFDDT